MNPELLKQIDLTCPKCRRGGSGYTIFIWNPDTCKPIEWLETEKVMP